MKKVVIIGAGVAGMSAGIHLLSAGYECQIIERCPDVGGNLCAWDNGDYHIDNCIHWLCGTRKGSKLNGKWREVGAIGECTEIYEPKTFYVSHGKNDSISYYRDFERTHREMLMLSPEDRVEIDRLFTLIGACVRENLGCASLLDRVRKIAGLLYYSSLTLEELAERFHHPLLRRSLCDYIGGEFCSLGLIFAYSSFASHDADVPKGGSGEMAQRIRGRYLSLGGELKLGAKVKEIVSSGKWARGVLLSDGEYVSADYVICACDPYVTFSSLLPRRSMPSGMASMYRHRREFPVYSAISAAFACDTDELPFVGTCAIPIRHSLIGKRRTSSMVVREFSHEPSYAPSGKNIIEVLTFLDEADSRRMIAARKSAPQLYKLRKECFVKNAMQAIEEFFPSLGGKLRVLNVWTPATYNRMFGSFCGAFMSFALTGERLPRKISVRPIGYENVVLAGEWLRPPGGLPSALESGITAADTIRKIDKKQGLFI